MKRIAVELVAVVLTFLLLFVLLLSPGCTRSAAAPPASPALAEVPARPAPAPARPPEPAEPVDVAPDGDLPALQLRPPDHAQTAPSGLRSVVLRSGPGTLRPGKRGQVKVRMVGYRQDGKRLPLPKADTFTVYMSKKDIVTQAVELMVVGEKRRFWIPLAIFGEDELAWYSPIFDIEVVDIIPGPAPIPPPADVVTPPKDATPEKNGDAWKIIQAGQGQERPAPQAHARIHFTVWAPSGEVLQSTRFDNRPWTVRLQQTTRVWERHVGDMVVGEKRLVWAAKGHGYDNWPDMKAGDPVLQEIELVSFIDPPPAPADLKAPPKDAETSKTGLRSRRLVAGQGAQHPIDADLVELRYHGWTTDGRLFHSSALVGYPEKMPLVSLPPGFAEGVRLMVVGEKRRLWIPAALGYPEGPGRPGGDLVIDVELVSIGSPPRPPPMPAPKPR